MAEDKRFKLGSKTAKGIRYDQTVQHASRRREMRSAAFDRGRDLNVSDAEELPEELTVPAVPEPTPGPSTSVPMTNATIMKDSRLTQLKEWKEKKERAKKLAKSTQKPVFKAGVVHHPLNPTKTFLEPVLASSKRLKAQSSPMKMVQNKKGVTTRNMTKSKETSKTTQACTLIAVPTKTKFQAPKGLLPLLLTIPRTPRGMAERKKAIATSALGFLPSRTTLPASMMNMESAARHPIKFSALASMPTAANRIITPHKKHSILPTNDFETIQEEQEGMEVDAAGSEPAQPRCHDSPFVTVRRGKRGFNYRRSSDTMVTSMEPSTSAMPPAALEHDATYYRNLLESEIDRLNTMSNEWEAIQPSLPTNVSDDISNKFDVVIGQTKLLIRSKFKQFRGLIEDCEAKTCVPPVHCGDLQGFWEMMYTQVKDLDKKFHDLESLKRNEWRETAVVIPQKKMKGKKAMKPPVVAKPSTGIRAMLLAARKKKMEDQQLEDSFIKNELLCAGDARVSAIIGTPEGSSKRRSLIQQVLLASATRRVQQSSPIIMKVSQALKRMSSNDDASQSTATRQMPLKPILEQAASSKATNDSTTHAAASRPSVKASSINNVTRATRGLRLKADAEEEEEDKENSITKTTTVAAGVIEIVLKKQSVVFREDCTPSPTPVARLTRRQTPYRKVVLQDDDLDESTNSSVAFTPRRSNRYTPRRNYSEGLSKRISLLGEIAVNSPATKPLNSGDLICFDSPQRRSQRVAKKL